MTTGRELSQRSKKNLKKLGLHKIPFTTSPTEQGIESVFTGREDKLSRVLNLFHGDDPRRILIYGHSGIGKTAFLLDVMLTLRKEYRKMLVAYISFPINCDLQTTALIALAKAMPDDRWAQQKLNQMGIPTAKDLKETNFEVGATGVGFTGKVVQKELPTFNSQIPEISFDSLLERAKKRYSHGVLIIIDDLDRSNSANVEQLISDAKIMFKGKSSFILAGELVEIAPDLLTGKYITFDDNFQLEKLDPKTTYKMLINYLNSARTNNRNNHNSVLPFSQETAMEFCRLSLGKPRLFNQLGIAVISLAADIYAEKDFIPITPEILRTASSSIPNESWKQIISNIHKERKKHFLLEKNKLYNKGIEIERLDVSNLIIYDAISEEIELQLDTLKKLSVAGDRHIYVNCIYETGRLYEVLDNWEKANTYYRDALRLFSSLQDSPGIAKSRKSLGNVLLFQGSLEKGMSELAQAREIYQQLGQTETAQNVDNIYQSVKQVLEQVKSEVLA